MQALLCEIVLGSILCKFCNAKKYWEVICASFVLRSSTGEYFVKAL